MRPDPTPTDPKLFETERTALADVQSDALNSIEAAVKYAAIHHRMIDEDRFIAVSVKTWNRIRCALLKTGRLQ